MLMTIMAIVGCTETSPISEPKLVIQGSISDDGNPLVFLTMSIAPKGSQGSLSDALVRWGKVTISDGDTSVILTGGPASMLFPPYAYYSHSFNGQADKTYTIYAEYGDYSASAVTSIPKPTPIDSIVTDAVADNDTLRSAKLWFTAPADCPAYYIVKMRTRETGIFVPCLLGETQTFVPGEAVSVPILMPKSNIWQEKYHSNLLVGDTLEIGLARVNHDAYSFWKQFSTLIISSDGADLLGEKTNLVGNVNGGYGIWYGEGISKTLLIVK